MRGALVLLLVCAVPLVARAGDGGAKAGIEAGNKKFADGVAKGDAAAIAAVYAPDAMILPPGAAPAKGKDAIQAEFAGQVKAFKKITLKTVEVYPMGNYALEVSSWTLADAAGKGPSGKAMVLWKKNGATWQIYRDMWSDNGASAPDATPASGPAPAAPAPAAPVAAPAPTK